MKLRKGDMAGARTDIDAAVKFIPPLLTKSGGAGSHRKECQRNRSAEGRFNSVAGKAPEIAYQASSKCSCFRNHTVADFSSAVVRGRTCSFKSCQWRAASFFGIVSFTRPRL